MNVAHHETTKAAIFFDAQYFSRCCRTLFEIRYRGSAGKQTIDYVGLARKLVGPHELFRAYYYDCLPYLAPTATPYLQERHEGHKRWLNVVRSFPRFQVRMGIVVLRKKKAVSCPECRHEFQPMYEEQKRVDVSIGVDMASLASTRAVSHMVLISGDQDFVPAVDFARSEGVTVTCVSAPEYLEGERLEGCLASHELINACDERICIDAELLESCLLHFDLEKYILTEKAIKEEFSGSVSDFFESKQYKSNSRYFMRKDKYLAEVAQFRKREQERREWVRSYEQDWGDEYYHLTGFDKEDVWLPTEMDFDDAVRSCIRLIREGSDRENMIVECKCVYILSHDRALMAVDMAESCLGQAARESGKGRGV